MKLISHSIFLKHDHPGHPERADRIKKALKQFKFEEAKDGEAYLNKVHTSRYIIRVKESMKDTDRDVVFLDAGETYVVKDTYKAACFAAGAAVQAAEYARQKQPAFALVRPPGHHAHPDWTNGFCIFNNVAIAAAYLAEKGEKVLIVDIDLHRGDGTMDFVQNCPKELDNHLFYFSINQTGVFPGMVFDEGNVKNVYLEPGTSEDEYISVLEKELSAVKHSFKPTIIAISAGFDAFATDRATHADQLGCGLSLSRKTVNALQGIIGSLPHFAVLEGGYNPDSVVEGVGAFLKVKVAVPKAAKETSVKKKTDSAAKGKTGKAAKVKNPKGIVNPRTKRSVVTASSKGLISSKPPAKATKPKAVAAKAKGVKKKPAPKNAKAKPKKKAAKKR